MAANGIKNVQISRAVLTIAIGVFKRLFFQAFFLPFYGLLAVPYILLFFGADKNIYETEVFRVVAVLSGKPHADHLNQVDLSIAVLNVFMVYNITAEIVTYVKGGLPNKFNAPLMKRRMYAQWVISLVGWTALGLSQYKSKGYELTLVLTAFGIIFCAIYWMEYNIRQMFANFKVKEFFGDKN